MSSRHFLQSLGRLHGTTFGDGERILQRIVSTCEAMLRDRGCVSMEATKDVIAAVDNGTCVLKGTREDGRATIVYFSADDKVGVKFARTIAKNASQEDELVIVSTDGPTPFTRKECDGQNIQFIHAKDVYVNKTKHKLVPLHESVASAPMGMTVAELPKIVDTDPIVQYYNWPIGTIVRIHRVFGGEYYRVVVAANS